MNSTESAAWLPCSLGRLLGPPPSPPAEQSAEPAAGASPQLQHSRSPPDVSPRQHGLRRLLPQARQRAAQFLGGPRRAASAGAQETATAGAERSPALSPRSVAIEGHRRRWPSDGGHHSAPRTVSPFAEMAAASFDDRQEGGVGPSSV